jgi:hypothetical protein
MLTKEVGVNLQKAICNWQQTKVNNNIISLQNPLQKTAGFVFLLIIHEHHRPSNIQLRYPSIRL